MKLHRNSAMICHSERSEESAFSLLSHRIVWRASQNSKTRAPYLPGFFPPAAARPNLYGVDLA
jgi:hypothetical protein